MFQPDFQNIIDVAKNKKPERLPLYEHFINDDFMEKVLDKSFSQLREGDEGDLHQFFKLHNGFYKDMTYDTVSFEYCITRVLPDGGALLGERLGPIQNRKDFENYPWDELPNLYWKKADRLFRTLGETMPEGMKAVGGVGNGVFEISEDLI